MGDIRVQYGDSTYDGDLRAQYENLIPGGFEDDDIMPQGEKTVNCNVNTRLFKISEERSEELAKEDRFGSVTGDRTVKDILPGEALFFNLFEDNVGHTYASNFAFGGSSGPVVFSSFNAEPITGKTQQEQEDQYRFFGFSKIPWFYSDPNWPQANGVSCRVGGTGTTANTGTKEFFPGDLARWRLRSIIESEREAERERLPVFKGVSPNKIYPIWEPFDPREVTHLPFNAMNVLMSDTTGEYTSLRTLDLDDEVADLPPEQEVAILLKNDTLTKVISALVTLQQYGLITIHTPNNENPLDRNAYSGFNNVLTESINKLNKHDVIRQKVGSDGVKLSVDDSNPADKALRGRQIEFLAYLLGVFSDPDRPYLRPSHSLVTALLARCNYGFLARPEDRAVFTVAAAFAGRSKKRSRNNDEIHYNEANISGRLAKKEAEASLDLWQAIKLSAERADSHIGFKATSHAFTGEILDYVI